MSTYRILRVVYDWPPPWDGLAPAPYELSKSQISIGNKVIALTGRLGGRRLLKKDFKNVEEKGNLVIYNLPRAIKRLGPFFTSSLCVLPLYFYLKLFRKIDLVHGHGHIMLVFNIYKRIFGKLDRTPYIAHFHITAAGREALLKSRGYKLDFFTRFIEYPLHKLSDRLGVKVANACLFVSKDLIDEAVKFYDADRAKCYLAESGVNTDLFRPNEKVKREKEILFIGMVDSRKNPDLVIKALEFLKDFRAVFVGRCSEEYKNELLDIAKQLRVIGRVEFKGYVPYHELLPYYRKASVFVLPSLYEGLPKVVLEALACGTPVVASGFVVKSPIKGLCIAKDLTPKSLAEKVEQIEKGKKEVDIKFIEDFYSWNCRAVEVQRIYDKVFKKGF